MLVHPLRRMPRRSDVVRPPWTNGRSSRRCCPSWCWMGIRRSRATCRSKPLPRAWSCRATSTVPPTEMDARIAVPLGAAPPETIEHPLTLHTDLVDPDIFITGEVHLAAPEEKEGEAKWQLIVRISSFTFHALLIALILLQAKLFPSHGPTPEQMEIARRMMTVLLPPGALDSLKPSTRPAQPPPRVHVDPRVLRKIAPPIEPAL